MSEDRRARRIEALAARRAEKRARQAASAPKGEQLKYVDIRYRNSQGHGFRVIMRAPRETMQGIADALRVAASLESMTPELALAQLDQCAEVFGRWNSDEPPSGFEGELAEVVQRLGRGKVDGSLIVAGNIYWLQTRGYLQTDEHNGVQFGFSVPGSDHVAVRSTLAPQKP